MNPHGEPAGEKKEADASKEVDPIEAVWGTYVEVMEPRRRELDPESRRIIRDALKVADVAELKRAIVGNKASNFHQGANDRGKKYNALSQILKGKRGGRTTREQIDFFIEIADKSGASNPGLPSADPAKLASAKRWVLTAWEYQGNAQAQAASKEATGGWRSTDTRWSTTRRTAGRSSGGRDDVRSPRSSRRTAPRPKRR